MKIRTIDIHGCDTCKKVLLHMRNEYRGMKLEISAWHEKDGKEYFQRELISFDTPILLERYMFDFSEVSANEFANAFEFPEEEDDT